MNQISGLINSQGVDTSLNKSNHTAENHSFYIIL